MECYIYYWAFTTNRARDTSPTRLNNTVKLAQSMSAEIWRGGGVGGGRAARDVGGDLVHTAHCLSSCVESSVSPQSNARVHGLTSAARGIGVGAGTAEVARRAPGGKHEGMAVREGACAGWTVRMRVRVEILPLSGEPHA
jgi:hypothetical protein